MTTTWADLGVIGENLVQSFFGSYVALSLATFAAILLIYLYYGVPFDIAIVTLTPMLFVFGGAGWLGANQWILLVVAALLALIATPFLRRAYTGR